MKSSITIIGLASQKIVKYINIPEVFDEDQSLMSFLKNNGVTVASSCDGVGACKKCLCNKSLLSCQITLKSFIEQNPALQVEISYL